jgi:hypothetical protein
MLMPGTTNTPQHPDLRAASFTDAARGAEEIRISNRATYWPVAPIDLVVGAPLVARLLLGASPVGRVVQAAALGAYLGSAIRDWRDRQGIRRIDFPREFGADVDCLLPMPREVRAAEVHILAARLNEEFTDQRLPRQELTVEVDRHLTEYIAGITGQHVRTSVEVRAFTLARLAFPFALGTCDILSGDIAIFADTGFFEPHIIAHEFCHRKGYWKELHAQALAYLALAGSRHPALKQAALLERAYRNLRVLCDDDVAEFNRLVARGRFRPELRDSLLQSRPPSGGASGRMEAAMRSLYDARMRLTGQNGISDYDLGFTNFLYTFETSDTARRNQRQPETRR